MKTLVVEDDVSMRNMLLSLLELRGHDAQACGDAEAALGVYGSTSFDLVILDRFLPGMDGLELCEQMRSTPQGEKSVIFVFTSAQKPEDLHAALASGADDYMTKPLNVNLLNVRLTIAESQVQNRQRRLEAESERDAAVKELEASRDDMLSILNQLALGTATTDTGGHVTFLSEAAERLFQTTTEQALGRHWTDVFPLGAADKTKLQRQESKTSSDRERVPVRIESGGGKHYWMEIDVKDDPRHAERSIFVLYDVTEIEEIRRKLETGSFQELVGNSEPMQSVYHLIRELARFDTTVLLEGETGTGKELAARAIHRSSPRHDKPFLAVNCAGLPESLVSSLLFGHRRGAFTGAVEEHLGVFEAAEGGTIFLDEIGDIPPNVQTTLLRVLQEREITRLGESNARKIDVRILTATHHDLGQLVEQGTFRMDLLYRIRVARIRLPPLRDRRKDIPLLAAHFLDDISETAGREGHELAPDTLQFLMSYSWPGNVRELRGAMEYSLIRARSPVIQPNDLPPEIINHMTNGFRLFSDPLDDRARILEALDKARGNRSKAAQMLGISRATFYRRLKKLGAKTA